ncbi:MAG: hypothetical protein WAO21_02340 [Verrucomicrobiia bacterium]
MNWKNIPCGCLVGGYIDLLNESLPNVPYHPDAAITHCLRGRIEFVSRLRKLPTFQIGAVKKFDSRLRRWNKSAENPTLTLKLADFDRHNGLLRPIHLKKGTLLMHTMNGITAMIYPNGVRPPKTPPLAKEQSGEIIDLITPK